MVPDASQGDMTPAFRISSTQGSEGSRTLRGLIDPDNPYRPGQSLSTRTMVTTSAATSYSTR
jgi:hypothetical protein